MMPDALDIAVSISRDVVLYDEDTDEATAMCQTGQALAMATAYIDGRKTCAMVTFSAAMAVETDDETLGHLAIPMLREELQRLAAGSA